MDGNIFEIEVFDFRIEKVYSSIMLRNRQRSPSRQNICDENLQIRVPLRSRAGRFKSMLSFRLAASSVIILIAVSRARQPWFGV